VQVVGRELKAGDRIFNLGDEIKVADGVYSIREVTPAYSRKNGCQLLKNSVYIALQSL
jgi:hypothetical protein